MTTRQKLSAAVLAAVAGILGASVLRAQEVSLLFFEGDMVRGATGGGVFGPVCVLTSQYRRKEMVVWRIRVRDRSNQALDDKGLKSLVVELPDGQKFPMKFGPHPVRGPVTDHFWATSWVIPDSYPTGSLSYKVTATDSQDRTHTWEPFKVGISQLTVIP
jgi:hypothetical protein